MKLVTFRSGDSLRPGVLDASKGILDLTKAGSGIPNTLRGIVAGGDAALAAVKAAVASAPADAWVALKDGMIATPLPGATKNIFCVGRNYKLHIAEMAKARGLDPVFPKVPEFFSKPPTTVIGQDDGIERHAEHTEKLDYEVELAVVIGKKGRNISEADALDYVFGYTVLNDVTARDAQSAHIQFFKGKSFDTFCPIGPSIVTKDEFGAPGGKRLTLKVNGGIRQDSNTSDLLFNVPQIIASLSKALTLEPGDIIATGTPAGVAGGMSPPGWLQVGDVVEAEVDGIGVLRNKVIA